MATSHQTTLQTRHAGLEAQLRREQSRPAPDPATLQKLKREKLRIKEALSSR